MYVLVRGLLYHQHVEDKAASEDGDVSSPPLRGHELAVKVEHWRWLGDLDTGVSSATLYGVLEGRCEAGEAPGVPPH